MIKVASSRRLHAVAQKLSLAILMLCIAVAAPLQAAAQLTAPEAPPVPAWRAEPEPFSGRSAMARMVGGLAFCVGTFLIGVRLYRRFAGIPNTQSKRRMRVIERISVTQKGGVALVAVDDQEFLIALGSEAPRMIAKISKNTTEDFVNELCRQDNLGETDSISRVSTVRCVGEYCD